MLLIRIRKWSGVVAYHVADVGCSKSVNACPHTVRSVRTWLLHESVDLVHGEVNHVGQVLMVDLLNLVNGAPSSLRVK